MYIADFHIHSKYSRATSRDCDIPHLDFWARRKGVRLLGTGDFTHPAWRKELEQSLTSAAPGVYRLKSELRLPGAPEDEVRFLLTGEISTIYKKDGKTRKVHHLILLPSLEAAEELSRRLELIGNLHSDGRPILGLDSRDLLEITLDSCPEAVFIPAHIWTPHFSLFGAFSQFSTIEECYGDLADRIHALETGLSSDPPMNRRLSRLDDFHLVSNSDAHSPSRIAREATILEGEADYPHVKQALDSGDGLMGTIEFFPEEGKYHLDGHRSCKCRLEPAQTRQAGGRCPVCGKKITVGVLSRVEELADRDAPIAPVRPYECLMPLTELLADCLGVSAASKKAQALYEHALRNLGSELFILRQAPVSDVEKLCGPLAGEALRRLRAGQVIREAGYDGEYGKITLFLPGERERLLGQMSLIDSLPIPVRKRAAVKAPEAAKPAAKSSSPDSGENPEQTYAVLSRSRAVAVVAGPGTGKTHTLTERVARLISEEGIRPTEITAVTFTHQAAAELRTRLEQRLGGKKAVQGLTVGTFHAVCLEILPKKPLAGQVQALDLMEEALKGFPPGLIPAEALRLLSARRNGVSGISLPEGLEQRYQELLDERDLRDLDGILMEALEQDVSALPRFRHLLVDEYQDINALQRKLVAHWMRESLFVIGDADQSIYGFRGASAGCFDELKKRIPDLEVIHLTRNYRSSPPILECAQSAIRHNPGSRRALIPVRTGGVPVRLISAPDPAAEGEWIAREIARMAGGVDMLSAVTTDSARAFSDMAVLCRTRRQLSQIEKCLAEEGIPCAVCGRDDSLEQPAVRGVSGFFSSLLHPENPTYADAALRFLWKASGEDRAKALNALEKLGFDLPALHGELDGRNALRSWLNAVEALLPRLKKEKPRRLIQNLETLTGIPCPALTDAALFFSGMGEMIRALETGEEGDWKRFRGRFSPGAVRLMTLHGSKGLEFPVVFLAGINRGDLPGASSDEREERRLFFVGITRARDELILTHSGEPSPFLDGLPGSIVRETARNRRVPKAYEQLSFF